ncbi:MAG: hypothetical protein BGO05_28310 [Rhizobiales bacterium 63-7]|nr:hypothetical protein [Hyphomicrobiales bacterium]OJU68637.1 MAG: hypothetical protein BGO05_28310 [Rhizobiales bacterium 63-7]
MGFALLKDVDEVFAPIAEPPRTSQAPNPVNRVKEIEGIVSKRRADLFAVNQALRNLVDTALEANESRYVIAARGDIVRFERQMYVSIEQSQPVLARLSHEANEFLNTFRFPNAQAKRHFRQLNKRLSVAYDQYTVFAKQSAALAGQELLPRIDQWLRNNVRRPASFEEATDDLISRYPVVSDYLAR